MEIKNPIYNEWKFLVPGPQIGTVLRVLNANYSNTDAYPVNEVGSYYFDSLSRKSYEECLDGSNVKRKFRMRTYSGAPIWQLQVKEKHLMTVKKWKWNVSQPENDFLSWNELLEEASKRDPRPEIAELLAASSRYGRIFPTLDIRYKRHRYRAFDMRMNLDEGIRFTAGPNLRSRVAGIARLPFAVFEIKTTSPRPHIPLFDLVKLQPISFSKYAMGMSILMGEPEALGKYF